MTPDDRKYRESHEWVRIEGDTATVGISDHAQGELGDITFIDCPAVGQVLDKGQDCAVVESVKAASDIYAPVSGEVSEINEALEDGPELVNEDPYGAGWIFKLKNVKAEEAGDLLSAAEYEDSIA